MSREPRIVPVLSQCPYLGIAPSNKGRPCLARIRAAQIVANPAIPISSEAREFAENVYSGYDEPSHISRTGTCLAANDLGAQAECTGRILEGR